MPSKTFSADEPEDLDKDPQQLAESIERRLANPEAPGKYYTPQNLLPIEPAAGTGAFLLHAISSVIGNPPYGQK